MPGGRPLIFETNEELQTAIKKYFKTDCNTRPMVVGSGKFAEVINLPVPTVTGLALYLGFATRQSFYDYEKREEFSYTIKKARTTIECNYEEQLQMGNVAGAIFALKNFGWSDASQLDVTSGNEPIHKLSDEQLVGRINQIVDKARDRGAGEAGA